ncbi:amidase [Gracilaria domingensis]|nr:amidase [Gracilaria domingensis]
MRWLSHEWKTLSSTIIQSCWQQSLGNIDADKHQFLVESSREEAYEINELLNEVARVCGRINIRSLLYSPDERDCVETVDLETLRDSVVDRLVSEKIDSQAFSLPEVPVLPPVHAQLKAFAIVRQVLDERGMIDNHLRTVVRDVQRAIRAEQAAKTGRTLLFGFGGCPPARQTPQADPVQQATHTHTAQPTQQTQHAQLSPQTQPVQPSQSSQPSQGLQPPQQSHLSQSFQQAQQTQQSYKNDGESASSPVLGQATAAGGAPWARFSKANIGEKSSEEPSRDQNRAAADLNGRSATQVDAPEPDGNRLNDGQPEDVPILTIADDDSAIRGEESSGVADQMEEPLHNSDAHPSEQHSNELDAETKAHISETSSHVDIEQPVAQDHTTHGEPEVDGSQMEFSHPEVTPQESHTEALEISEAPS